MSGYVAYVATENERVSRQKERALNIEVGDLRFQWNLWKSLRGGKICGKKLDDTPLREIIADVKERWSTESWHQVIKTIHSFIMRWSLVELDEDVTVPQAITAIETKLPEMLGRLRDEALHA